jgi:hypothetical protein
MVFVHDAQNNSSLLIPEVFLYSRTITYHPPLSFDQAVHCVARSRGCHYPRHVLILRAHIEVKVRPQIFRSSLRKERFLRKEITLRSRRATKLKFRSKIFLIDFRLAALRFTRGLECLKGKNKVLAYLKSHLGTLLNELWFGTRELYHVTGTEVLCQGIVFFRVAFSLNPQQ